MLEIGVRKASKNYGNVFQIPTKSASLLAISMVHRALRLPLGDQRVLKGKKHICVDKNTGETAHVERWNNTLRQRLGRFVRKTLSFSKSILMHEVVLKLFIHHYNLLCYF